MLPAAMTAAKTAANTRRRGVVGRVVEAERLEQAPQPVVEVEAEQQVGDDVDQRHRHHLEADHHVVVDVLGVEVGMRRPDGQVEQVVDDEDAR